MSFTKLEYLYMESQFKQEYAKLNDRQRQAVNTIDGPLIVIAGPGSGKTQLLSLRIANILRKTDSEPGNILCLTFTEAAAMNMRKRLLKIVGSSANKIQIYTFHGFGESIINNYPEYFYNAPLLNHLNELSEYELLERLLNKLSHDNPLAKKINGRYLHIKTLITMISWFKRAGLDADDIRTETIVNRDFYAKINKYLSKAFISTPSYKNLHLYTELLVSLEKISDLSLTNIGKLASVELKEAIDQISPDSRYVKPITAWRNRWLTQVRLGVWQFSDQSKSNFLLNVANIFEDYQKELANKGLYTFDDMVLRPYQAMMENEELLLNLQEQYQYILVDEYQDTNGVQDKILDTLANNPVNEDKPNLMVVGDDDQAIYRFQGADSSVMQNFILKWDPETIILNQSYRSPQPILNLARKVIIKSEDRLENINAKIKKELRSEVKTKGNINSIVSLTQNNSNDNVAKTINNLIKNGEDPGSIAVLSTKHRYLEELIPFLIDKHIPINYERREQIFNQPRIIELLDLIELITAASNLNFKTLNHLLPKIISANYWQLSQEEWWQIAIDSSNKNKSWLEIISDHENVDLRNFATAIKQLAKDTTHLNYELILLHLLGQKPIKLKENSFWYLPWKEYYFNDNALIDNASEFINFSSQFKLLNEKFKEWAINFKNVLTLNEFTKFIDLYRKSQIPLSTVSTYSSADSAVNLLTAYKAKGLEWKTVFILNIHDDVWGSKTRSQNLTFNLPSTLKWIEPTRVSSNDLNKLLYVAITRAKQNIYFVDFENKNDGRSTNLLSGFDDIISRKDIIKTNENVHSFNILNSSWQDSFNNPTKKLNILLKPVIDNYELSATHLIDFLAVDRGGPKLFMFQHLLKVPSEINISASYGDSIHKTLEYTHTYLTKNKKLPSIKSIINYFDESIISQPLTKEDLKFYKKMGEDNLSNWFKLNKYKLGINDISEYDFKKDSIYLDNARLTGKIDVLKVLDQRLTIVDYKTSKPIDSWDGLKSSAAIKSHNYKNQLMFYKLLVDNSSKFTKYISDKAVIEFLTADEDGNHISLELNFDSDELNRIKKLIAIVWDKIINLDMPDTTKYKPSLSGIKQFESDLLSGQI